MSNPNETAPASGRVRSIDALRGFDMFCIVGGQDLVLLLTALFAKPLHAVLNAQLSHAEWEGFTGEDLIMPLFLFIVGAAMPFSFARWLETGQSKVRPYLRIIRRVLVLWVLGMVAQGNLLAFDLSKLQVFSNTLQAIAVGYLVAAIVLMHLPLLGQALVTLSLLGGYWALMIFVPFDGKQAGILEPDRKPGHLHRPPHPRPLPRRHQLRLDPAEHELRRHGAVGRLRRPGAPRRAQTAAEDRLARAAGTGLPRRGMDRRRRTGCHAQ